MAESLRYKIIKEEKIKDGKVKEYYGGGEISRSLLDLIYPVGIIVEFSNDTNPNDYMLGQKWVIYGAGKTTVCQDSGTFKELGGTVGEETHVLSVAELPNHYHSTDHTYIPNGSSGAWGINYISNAGDKEAVGAVGENKPHNNIQPSIVVVRWTRIE